MTATLERPQLPGSPSRGRHGASYWHVALAAVLALSAGVAVGFWWGDSDGGPTDLARPDDAGVTEVSEETPTAAGQDGAERSVQEQGVLTTLDEWTAALNTGDIDLVKSFYAPDAELGWIVDGVEVAVEPDEYFQHFSDTLARGYEFVSVAVPTVEFGMAAGSVQVLMLTNPVAGTEILAIGRHMAYAPGWPVTSMESPILQEWLLWQSGPL